MRKCLSQGVKDMGWVLGSTLIVTMQCKRDVKRLPDLPTFTLYLRQRLPTRSFCNVPNNRDESTTAAISSAIGPPGSMPMGDWENVAPVAKSCYVKQKILVVAVAGQG